SEWNLLETRSTSNGLFGGFRWDKLYDRIVAPQISVPAELNLGTAHNGVERTADLLVSNPGTATLVVQNISCSDHAVTISPRSFNIAPGGNAHVSVKWLVTTAIRPGTYHFSDSLTITSNDPTSPTTVVKLSMTVIGGAPQ